MSNQNATLKATIAADCCASDEHADRHKKKLSNYALLNTISTIIIPEEEISIFPATTREAAIVSISTKPVVYSILLKKNTRYPAFCICPHKTVALNDRLRQKIKADP